MENKEIIVAKRLLESNDIVARRVREKIKGKSFVFNMISSPGSGKTTLLEKTASLMKERAKIAIMTADIDTDRDKKRLERSGVKVIQINTKGGCHLNAATVEAVIEKLFEEEIYDFIFIENVGNLICPSGFDLGEHIRIILLSIPEGDDKVQKYPLGFKTSHLFLLTKIDLLPYIPFDKEKVIKEAKILNPNINIIEVSSITGDGIKDFINYLIEKRKECMNME